MTKISCLCYVDDIMMRNNGLLLYIVFDMRDKKI